MLHIDIMCAFFFCNIRLSISLSARFHGCSFFHHQSLAQIPSGRRDRRGNNKAPTMGSLTPWRNDAWTAHAWPGSSTLEKRKGEAMPVISRGSDVGGDAGRRVGGCRMGAFPARALGNVPVDQTDRVTKRNLLEPEGEMICLYDLATWLCVFLFESKRLSRPLARTGVIQGSQAAGRTAPRCTCRKPGAARCGRGVANGDPVTRRCR